MANNSYDHHMQEDVVIEILSRLPVKSLLRFRCVCKYWCILLKNSNFINKQLNHQNRSAYLLVERYSYGTHIYALALFHVEPPISMPIVYHDLEDPHTAKNPSIIDTCNGVICFWDGHEFALWNPNIREFKSLPVSYPNLPPYTKAYCEYFGFGLDPVTNNYKVVWIQFLWDEKDDFPHDPAVVLVYNQGTDTWTPVETDFSQADNLSESLGNTCINGVYHWLVSDSDFSNHMVLQFDMKKDAFQKILEPPYIQNSQIGYLAFYNESIAMVIYDPNEIEKQFDIWVMMEEGYWTKQLTIGPFSDVEGPLGCSKKGDFIFYSNISHLVIYNPITKEIKYDEPHGELYSLKVFVYEESLASVKGENECSEGENTLWSELKCFSRSIRLL
ncbi:F-box/kelch-repeat protein At3g23880-like [Cornus florida]|uniref:F-box/kelch-repeat protein At3g23880-like n=1 Tax=Cornus florida TaxID=4283 RepID=UPI00289BEFD7|nr:F-box/kelch-repeat protein At3g23880-like [Cornus florida]